MSYSMRPAYRGVRDWRDLRGLGTLDNAQTYGVGQQLVAGYNVQSSADAATKLQAVRDAMAYGFRGSIVSAGWGGPNAPGGVPAGQIYIVVRIGATGITGQLMNQIFSNVGANIQTRLPAGSRVTNTYASIYQGLVSGSSGSSAVTAPTTGGGILDSLFAPTTTTTPTTTDTTLPTDLTATTPQPFFMQEVGGVPVWVLGIGGVALLGGIAFVALRKPHAAPKVTANRRRRVRRNGWRRRASRALKGRRRSRSKRASMRMNRRSRRSVRTNRRSRRSRRSVRANRRRHRPRRDARAGETRRRFARVIHPSIYQDRDGVWWARALSGKLVKASPKYVRFYQHYDLAKRHKRKSFTFEGKTHHVNRNSKLTTHQRAMAAAARSAHGPQYAAPRNYLGGRRTYDWGMYGYPFVSGRKRRAKLSRKSRASMKSLRRNDGFEYGVHGNNKGVYNDPFERMSKADADALVKLYTSEVAAVRVANRLQRKYGHMIEFRVKSRPKSSGGFGQTVRYSHLDVAHPHRMRRARAKMRKSMTRNSASVTYQGKRYTRRVPRPGDVFYMAKPVGTVPLLSSFMKLHKGGVIEDMTTGTKFDARIANVKTAWVRARAR